MASKAELFEAVARSGRALGSGKRLELLDLLAQAERSVQELAAVADLNVTTASAHLQVLRDAGLARYARSAPSLLHYTGYERSAESIRVDHQMLRRIGQMLGSADILAQMSDRCYLEKCRDRLYPEFVAGGVARALFRSAHDLVRRTPAFFHSAAQRLDLQLARAHEYAGRHFGGQNLYLEEIHKNVRHARLVADSGRDELLRRALPLSSSASA